MYIPAESYALVKYLHHYKNERIVISSVAAPEPQEAKTFDQSRQCFGSGSGWIGIQLKPGFGIRIRIRNPDPDPHSESRSGSKRLKLGLKSQIFLK
jgi:hypothetical protein